MEMLLKQNNDIQYSKFRLTKKGLEVIGVPTYQEWEDVGKFIRRSHEAVQFWRGDWLNYGENNYDQWSQYFSADEAAYGTLRNEKWVSSRIPPSRRRDNLSWSHHEEIADLEPEEQDLMLDMAEKHAMSVSTFRKAVRHYKLKMDVPELNEEQLKPTDPAVFEKVQEVIDASVKTLELLEVLDWSMVQVDAKDYLLSHLKRAGTHYFSLVKRYDKQKPLSEPVV